MVIDIRMSTETIKATEPFQRKIWIDEFGLLEPDVCNQLSPDSTEQALEKLQGRLYRLSSETAKRMGEILGFTAKFDSHQVRTAYVDIFRTQAQVHFEIAKSTKPIDVGLRYTADRWLVYEPENSTYNQPGSSRPWLSKTYQAKFLTDKILGNICDLVKLKREAQPLFFLRVNFKDQIYGLLGDGKASEKFPTGAFNVFSLKQSSVPAVFTPKEPKENSIHSMEETEIRGLQFTSSKVVSNTVQEPASSSPKYATYSRSEIDQLVRQQSESLQASFAQKTAGLQKSVQEALKVHERQSNKILMDLQVFADDTKKKLETSSSVSENSLKALAREASNDLAHEIEQFKQQLSKNISSNLKSLESRVQKVLKEQSEHEQANQKSNPIITIMSASALVLSSLSLVLAICSKH